MRGYLRYWERHNREVFAAVPEDRLLVVRLDELDTSQQKLGGFLGISADTLPQRSVRSNTRKDKAINLEDIGSEYAAGIASEECGAMMSRLYPALSSD